MPHKSPRALISASRIDVASLKASLITAGNINALTLTTTKGSIGGWSIDSDSIYRGTKKNAANTYTAASGSMTVGSTGIRGYKWRLESTGAGAVAGGNIVWDASGNVTFAASVSLQWTAPIDSITTALGGNTYPKLTKITAAGIYTGSITGRSDYCRYHFRRPYSGGQHQCLQTGYGQRESLAGYGRQHRSPYAEWSPRARLEAG